MSNLPTTIRVSLSPTPGFCIKSTSQNSITCPLATSSAAPSSSSSLPRSIIIPLGIKVFVNIAWDSNVPPPPEGSEEAIQKAMLGEDDADADAIGTGGWFVPVVVSEPRQDKDKCQCCFPSCSLPPVCRLIPVALPVPAHHGVVFSSHLDFVPLFLSFFSRWLHRIVWTVREYI